MKTATLNRLFDSLTEVRHFHLASALLEFDPARQARERNKAYRVGAILDAIRFELCARKAGAPTADAARRSDRYLERLLADFLEFGDVDGGRTTPAVAEGSVPAVTHVAVTAAEIDDTGDFGTREPAVRHPPRRGAAVGSG